MSEAQAASAAGVAQFNGPISAGIGAIGGLASTYLGGKLSGKNSAKAAAAQYNYNLALQKQAQEWNEYMYRNRYQMQVEDLEKAGINKLYGLGNAGTLSSGITSTGLADPTAETNATSDRIMQGINTVMDWSARRAQIKNIEQQTKTEEHNTLLKQFEALNSEYEAIIKKKEIDNWDETRLEELNNLRADTIKKLAETTESGARTESARANSAKTKEETKELERINQFYKEHPKLGKMISASKELQELSRLLTEPANTVSRFIKK